MLPNLDNESLTSLKKWSTRIVFVIILGIIIAWYLSNSWVYITTKSDNATISLTSNGVTEKSSTKKHLFTAIKPGSYTVSVESNTGMTTKTVNLRHGLISTMSLNIDAAHHPKFIATKSAHDIAASNNLLTFVDTDKSNGIERYTTSGTYEKIANGYDILDSSWLNPDYGAAIYANHEDSSDAHIGAIINGDLTEIESPADLADVATSIAVGKDKTIYLAIGSTLYQKSVSADKFSELYSAPGKILSITSANNSVTIYKHTIVDDDVSGEYFNINVQSKHRTKSVEASYEVDPNLYPVSSQAPDDNHTAIIVNGVASVYDKNFDNQIILPATKAVMSTVWITDDTIAYTSGGSIFTYSLSTGMSKAIIHNTGDNYAMKNIAIDQERENIYYLRTGPTSVDTLMRVSLKNSANDTTSGIDKLSKIFPYPMAIPMCRADITFFTKPLIVISKLSEDDQQSQQDNTTSCVETTKEYLTRQSIDPNSVPITTTIVDSLTDGSSGL